MALPSYESQKDFDQYRPENAGSDFQEENEFVTEILKRLPANSVLAIRVNLEMLCAGESPSQNSRGGEFLAEIF